MQRRREGGSPWFRLVLAFDSFPPSPQPSFTLFSPPKISEISSVCQYLSGYISCLFVYLLLCCFSICQYLRGFILYFLFICCLLCCSLLCQYLVGGKQKILCWQISRCQKGFPNNFYPPVASNTISKQTTQSKRKTSKQPPISYTNTLTIILRA